LRKHSRSMAASCLAWFVAIFVGMTLMPGTAQAAKDDDPKQTNHEPPNKLRKAGPRAPETRIELTDAGKALADKFAAMLVDLQAEIARQVPPIVAAKQEDCRKALAAQKLASVKYDIAEMNWRRGCQNQVTGLQSAQEKLEEAPGRLADAEMVLKNALAMPDDHEDKARAVEEAERILEKRKADLEKLPEAVATGNLGNKPR